MKYNAIIFDMDGTIVDTEILWKKATQTVIANRGHTLSEHDQELLHARLLGMNLANSCKIIQELTQTTDSIDILMKEKAAIACQLYKSGIRFIEGFEEFHKKVIGIPLKVGIATNATIETMELTNQSLNLHHYFGHHRYTINHVNNIGKPNPAIYLYAAKQLAVVPELCIAIEDSAHGITAAKAAGMFCIGINTGKNPEQIKQADLQVEKYQDIDLHSLLKV